MRLKNTKVKVLAGLLYNLDLGSRSHRLSGLHSIKSKKNCFVLWKQKFLNRITHKQVIRGIFKIAALSAKRNFLNRLATAHDKLRTL